MKIRTTDTIAAVATPSGEGAIAVIRVSGPDAFRIADGVFRGHAPLSTATSHTVHHGSVVDADGEVVDDGLATVFRSPRSYTGEDVVEISCHGGIFVTNAVLENLLRAGARQAEPGEFTRRAFLNGKMDLSRAEAVASLIASTSRRAHRASMEQLTGRLAGAVGDIRGAMTSLCALLEIDLDFSEEGISLIDRDEIEKKIRETKSKLEKLADTFMTGRLYRDGVSVVIAGKPNVGKSSLFNALLKESRAIVNSVPGTTRDFLEESITMDGMLFRLTDTAGLRESGDDIEVEGILRSRKALERADIVIIVDDASSSPATREDLLGEIQPAPHHEVIIVRNKIDLNESIHPGEEQLSRAGSHVVEVNVSARTGEGVHALTEALVRLVADRNVTTHESVQITSRRHWDSLQKAKASLVTALDSLNSGVANEFVAFDLREANSSLSEITGEVTSDDVLNSIFAGFCIGK